VRRSALQLAARAVERRLNADHSDGQSPTQPCSCGHPARFAGRQRKTFETALGPVTIERAYYHCRPCGRGWFPRHQALGMAATSLSPAVTRLTGSAAAVASFATASDWLDELAAVRVNAKRVERVAEALGREVAAAERAAVFAAAPPAAATMYLGVDGTGVPMRPAELVGRPGKQPDGAAGTREAKLVVIWTADQFDQDGRPVCDQGSVSYAAAMDSAAAHDTDPAPAAFTQRLRRAAARRGFPQAARRVILGHGAKWIWAAATEMFPGAIQIVDFFHVSERMWEVARALFPADRDSAEVWAEARCEELQAGALDSVLATLRAQAGHCQPGAKAVPSITTNRERMRYAEFRAQGLQIGSGVVEAGCKTVVGRLKQSGMYWTKHGAEGILALRACILGGRYEDFWAWRTESRLQAAA
jgi:hypothetical protein